MNRWTSIGFALLLLGLAITTGSVVEPGLEAMAGVAVSGFGAVAVIVGAFATAH